MKVYNKSVQDKSYALRLYLNYGLTGAVYWANKPIMYLMGQFFVFYRPRKQWEGFSYLMFGIGVQQHIDKTMTPELLSDLKESEKP